MTERIFRSICTAALAVFLACGVLILGVLYNYFTQQQMEQLAAQTELAALGVEQQGREYLEALPEDSHRITWIDGDGSVLFDSMAESGTMENHLQRQEVRDALSKGTGQSTRYSTTMLHKQLYAARRLSDGTVLRMADFQKTWWVLAASMLQPMLIIVIVAIVCSLWLASGLARRIVDPLNHLNLDEPKAEGIYSELEPLINRLAGQQRQLKHQAMALERRKNEFQSVISNMPEGLILLNEYGKILSINKSAKKILKLGSYCIGKDLLLFNSSIQLRQLMLDAAKGIHGEQNMTIGGCGYQVSASPVISEGQVSGVAVLLIDMSQQEKANEMRREFTANVSHELKTPLQSIAGCAELLSSGMVQPEDVPRFSQQIYDESKRMIALVQDIIGLSRLDEGAVEMERENTDLFILAEQTVESLRPVAEKAGVTLELSGATAPINGISRLLGGIIFNLCENAIKYNRSGGSVTVRVEQEGGCAVLTVADTGIGIPEKDQSRIFERFYRVDKSHSKSVGGTGLGLSIVKNSAKLHNASLHIDSQVGKGTTIQVRFPV